MNKQSLKLIMELIFIFILPLVFICFTSEIQVERNFEYDNEGNYQVSEDTKHLSFDNSIIKYTKSSIDYDWEETNVMQINGNSILIDTEIKVETNLEEDHEITLYDLDGKNRYRIYISTEYGVYANQYNLIYDYNYNTEFNMTPLILIEENTDYYIFQLTTTFNYTITDSYDILNNFYIYKETTIQINTIWGNIKQLLIENLDLNNNVLLDIILCYTILWIIMWILWHMLYGFLELIIHIIPKRE